MTKRSDEVKVGAMVIATVALLLVTFFLMINYNPFQAAGDEFKMNLKFASSLERDAAVRFGGLKRGKVTAVRLTPERDTAVEIVLLMQPGTGVKTDSIARVASLGALGENYVEVTPGKVGSPLLKPGEAIRSEETPAFSELFTKISGISDDAQKLLGDLNKNVNTISANANTLLANLNETTGPKNRESIAAALAGANGMITNANGMVTNANGLITNSAPKIDAIASNLQASTEKINTLTANIDDAATKLNKLLTNVDGAVTENRPQMKKDVEVLETTLVTLQKLLVETTALLDSNRSDINATMDELRRSSENLSQLTDSVKQRPYTLIRGSGQADRKVPAK